MTCLSFILANNPAPIAVAGYPGPQPQYGYPQYAQYPPGMAPYPAPQAFPGKYFVGIFPVKLQVPLLGLYVDYMTSTPSDTLKHLIGIMWKAQPFPF